MGKKYKAYLFDNGIWGDINVYNLAENVIVPFKVEYIETPIAHDCLFVFRERGFIYVIPMHIGEADPSCFVKEISDALYYDEIEYCTMTK